MTTIWNTCYCCGSEIVDDPRHPNAVFCETCRKARTTGTYTTEPSDASGHTGEVEISVIK